MILRFERTRLPSGEASEGDFNATHDPCFGDPDDYPMRHIEKAAKSLIEKWNRQQPNTWRYRLILKGNT
jgi:hypothetical protein